MLFTTTSVDGYKRLDSSNIRNISITFEQPVTMIVAANGKGKSSMMKVLSSLGLDKNDFYKHGSVVHKLDHQGEQYTLEIRPHDKHAYSFYDPNGVNLNTSGNVGSFVEYVKEHFGYDKEVDKLMRLRYRMTDMTPTQREAFITRFNPANLQLLATYYKQISSATRNLKSQIKLLEQRKATLTDQLLSDEKLVHLEQVSLDRASTIKTYEEALLLLRNRIQDITHHIPTTTVEYDELLTRHDHLVQQLYVLAKDRNWSKYGYHDLSIQVESIQSQQSVAESRIQSLLTTYEKYKEYQSLDVQKELSTRTSRLQEIEALLPHLKVDLTLPTDEQVVYRTIAYLKEVATIVSDLHAYRLYGPTQVSRITSKLEYLRYKHSNLQKQLVGVETEIESMERQLVIIQSESVPKECTITVCDMRLRLEQRLRTHTDKLTQLYGSVGVLQLQIERYGRVVGRLSEIVTTQLQLKPKLDRLVHIENVEWLKDQLLVDDLISTINHQSTTLCSRCGNLISMLEDRLTYHKLKTERDKLALEIAQINSKDIPVQALVDQMVNNTQLELYQLQTSVQGYTTNLNELQCHQTTQSNVLVVQQELQQVVIRLRDLLDRDLMRFYVRILRTIEGTIEQQYQTATQIQREERIYLEEQKSLHTILNQEVLPTLSDITNKYKEYQLLQEALSPKSGYPNQYLVDYINQHINTTNQILKTTWNYDMAMIPLTRGEDITFEIGRTIEGEVAKDINMSSDSQKDIFDIAFCLAIIIGNGYGQLYPLYMDEVDKHFDESHREGLVRLIQDQIRSDNLRQIFMVNHHIVMNAGIPQSDVVCLSTDYIRVPDLHNEHVQITHF